MRLLQVLKNLISNSFKFTDIGKVTLYIDTAYSGWDPSIETLQKAKGVVAFTVQDSGIGISPDKQKLIFEAFQQGDGQTSRKYGGTGLGLSISREIATLLGGQLSLISSIPQGGSTFTLFLPDSSPDSIDEVNSADSESTNFETSDTHENTSRYQMEQPLADDRDSIAPGDQTLLIIEDDPKFAKIILDLAREKGFKGVICPRGSQALTLARTINFDAITLDIRIPDVDGWTILDILKRDSELRHIPVDVISVENSPIRGLSSGAFHYLVKPTSRAQIGATMDATRAFIDRPVKNLLLVTSDKEEEHQITELLKK
ncbi:MAG: ATP-binding protein [Actinomycetota bacterium]